MNTRLDSSPRKAKPEKRYCSEPGCTTLLSSYNEGDKCSCHGGWPSSPMTFAEHRDTFADLMDDRFSADDESGQLERREAA